MHSLEVIVSHDQSESHFVPAITLSKHALRTLSLAPEQFITLSSSDTDVDVLCLTNSAQSDLMVISADVAKRLAVPDQVQLFVKYDASSHRLKLGPILAILVNSVANVSPPFPALDTFLKEMIRFARNRHIFAYVVSLKDLADNKNTVSGWTLSNLKWTKGKFPKPNVVYNRITSRSVERTKTFIALRKNLAEQQITFFNAGFLNKWQVFKQLKISEQLAPHLPETMPLNNYVNFKKMLASYPVVFVKPVNGSLGRGIYRITRGLSGFTSQYTAMQGEPTKTCRNENEVYQYVRKRTGKNKYIMQQGIPMLHLDERAIDFRALMQKNKNGRWQRTSIVARIGPSHRFVSNISRGGDITSVVSILKKCGYTNIKAIRNKLLAVAKKVCDVIDQNNIGLYGELGIDLALTPSGKIYILEVNSKPSKTEDSIHPNRTSPTRARPSVRRLLDYTLYVSQYANK